MKKPFLLAFGMLTLSFSLVAVEMSISAEKQAHRQREGTKIESLSGEIREAGRRWILVTSAGTTYPILENLALQRAVKAARDDPADRYWTIDGEFTEFLEENYILTRKIVRTSRILPRSEAANPR